MTEKKLTTRALRRNDWPLIEALFGPNGACGGCWCMFWRAERGGRAWEAQKGAANRRAFRELVKSGSATGCLALAGGAPVGWCSVGPKRDFAYFKRSRSFAPSEDPRLWSVTCFYVPARQRGRGIASALLAEAVALARRRRASCLEGYPVVTGRQAQMPAAFAWTGVPALFEAAGFKREATAGKRLLYVLRL